jgi:hypothetical protein
MIAELAVDDLVPYSRNARTHTPAQVAEIAASIREFGFNNPVLVRDDKTIISGHGRVLAARKLGLATVPCLFLSHLTPTQARAYVLADNQLATHAGWDAEMLALELDELRQADIDPALLGFTDDDLADLLGAFAPETDVDAEPQIDKAEELRVKWGVETGQLWRLGEHRILCGDSTSGGDVEHLMQGEHADVCLTDPPYGLGDSATCKNDYDDYDDSIENLRELIAGAIVPLIDKMRVVLTPGNKNQYEYPRPSWTMAWFNPAGIGRGPWGFCCWQPIMCYGKDAKLAKGKGSFPDALVHQEGSSSDAHPCAKPMKLWAWLLDRVSDAGDIIYDPFSGSGTTIIACEQLGRKCRAIEISPGYVAVAIQRWADATGGTPELING